MFCGIINEKIQRLLWEERNITWSRVVVLATTMEAAVKKRSMRYALEYRDTLTQETVDRSSRLRLWISVVFLLARG